MFRKLNISLVFFIFMFALSNVLFSQIEVNKISFKEIASLNNSIGSSGVSVNVFFRDAANRSNEFARKLKSIDFEGELNYWYVDSTLNEFSYEVFDCDLGSNPILIVTDFNWNINRLNRVFREKNNNVELKILKTSVNGKHFYRLVKSSGMCTAKEEFDFYMQSIELTIKDLSEVYNSIERLGDQKYVSSVEFKKLQNSTDSMLCKMNLAINDSLKLFKQSLNAATVNDEGYRFFLGLQGFTSFNFNNYFERNVSALLGGDYKFKNFQFSISVGPQQLQEYWAVSRIPYVESRLNSAVPYFNQLIITGKNVSEDFDLKVNSLLIALDMKFSLGDSRFFAGVFGNYSKPFSTHLSFENTEGMFNYIGLSSTIEETLQDIPEIGLFSNVSYVGYKSNLFGKLESFCQLGALMGYSLGEKSLLDINFCIGYITAKKFDLEQTNSAISSSYGNYNSLLTVNNSQVIIPGYLNFGFGIRKYLN